MKLLSLNVGLFEKNNRKLEDFFTDQQPDLVCLQEVTRRASASAISDYVTYDSVVKSLPTLPYSFYGATGQLADFKKYDFHGQKSFECDFGGSMEFGNLVMSRFPIVKARNVFVQGEFSLRTNWDTWPEEDYRAVEEVDVLVGGTPLRLLNYHGIWTRNKKDSTLALVACRKIKELGTAIEGSVIITGDFNLFPETVAMRQFEPEFESLVDRYKIKTTRPQTNELNNLSRNVVDYILTRGVDVKTFEVINSEVSDHLPLMVEFDLLKSN